MSDSLVEWVAWYTSGRKFVSTDNDWESLPQEGILWLQLRYSSGRTINYNGMDLFWAKDGIFANDNDRDGLLRRLPFVKFGRWVPDSEFQEVAKQAMESGRQWNQAHVDLASPN